MPNTGFNLYRPGSCISTYPNIIPLRDRKSLSDSSRDNDDCKRTPPPPTNQIPPRHSLTLSHGPPTTHGAPLSLSLKLSFLHSSLTPAGEAAAAAKGFVYGHSSRSYRRSRSESLLRGREGVAVPYSEAKCDCFFISKFPNLRFFFSF